MRNREKERKRNREKDVTDGTQDLPPLAACVNTLPEAVQYSLANGFSGNSLFIFARALKAFEITTGAKLRKVDLESAFTLWWHTAKALLPADSDFDEYRMVFEDAFAKVRSPLGANPLQEAIRRARTEPPPPQADRYAGQKLKHLVAVCYQLQVLSENNPFFLGVRDAARILETQNLNYASTILNGLVHDQVLSVVARGTPGGRQATRFRFQRAAEDHGRRCRRPQ